jgi:hypothetical protein
MHGTARPVGNASTGPLRPLPSPTSGSPPAPPACRPRPEPPPQHQFAARHALAPDWLNAHATAFTPATLDLADCEILLDHPALRVLGIPWNQLFCMKPYGGRPQDHEDLLTIWPRTTFASHQEAAQAFLETGQLLHLDPNQLPHHHTRGLNAPRRSTSNFG